MKRDYLEELEELLNEYEMEETEKNDILDDYNDMYEGWIHSGMSEEEVEDKLGKPREIVKELMEGYSFKRIVVSKNKDHKLVALMPFISLFIFFGVGFGLEMWAYAWIAFLLIPVTAILEEAVRKKSLNSLIGISPFFCLIGYLILGFGFDLWHPGWLIWLLIPVSGILIGNRRGKTLHNLTSLTPFIALVGYFILGELGYYHPGWLVFFIIPMVGILNEKKFFKVVLYEAVFIIGVVGYLYLWNEGHSWDYCLLAFIPIGLVALYHIYKEFRDVPMGYKVCIIASAALYIYLGYQFNLWAYAWLLFLSIPMYAIIVEVKDDDKLISLMPFISLIIFMTLGWFFSLWAFAWMAFLLIPMVAIIKE